MKVQFNNKSENPFFGMSKTLSLYQRASKGLVTNADISAAFTEVNTPEKAAMLMSILFSVGDITARQHYIFDSKVDSGGNAEREAFRDVVIPWLVKTVDEKKRLELMKLVMQYTTLDNILATRVKTKKNTEQVEQVINMIEVFGLEHVAQFCADIVIKGTEFEKMCLAKFLPRPVPNKRKHSKGLQETRAALIRRISDYTGWVYTQHEHNVSFDGYYEWRKPYTSNLESRMFASGKIKDFSQEEFTSWLNTLPGGARHRVKRRIYAKESQWADMKPWYEAWETSKEEAQTEQRELEAKVKSGTATKEDKAKLKEVKKKAKVTIGADLNFAKLYNKIVTGTVDKVMLQPFLDKVSLDYPTLVFVDDSGSMVSARSSYGFTAYDFAAFMATICLAKNPDAQAKQLIGLFSTDCRMFSQMDRTTTAPNSLMRGHSTPVPHGTLYDERVHFLDNLSRMRGFLRAHSRGRMTYISSVAMSIADWIKESPAHKDWISQYPVWTFVSDGNFNNRGNAAASIGEFMRILENAAGFRPFVILIDVAYNTSQDIANFTGVDGVLMVPPNPAQIEQILTNFRDVDVYDVYTPLQSLYRSNRYEPVRKLVLE